MTSDKQSENIVTILKALALLSKNKQILENVDTAKQAIGSIFEYGEYLSGVDIDVIFDKNFDYKTEARISELERSLKEEIAECAKYKKQVENLSKEIESGGAESFVATVASVYQKMKMDIKGLKKANDILVSENRALNREVASNVFKPLKYRD